MACFGVWIRAVCLCDVGVVFAHVHSVTSRSACVCVCAASARLSVDIYGLIMKVWREREERC